MKYYIEEFHIFGKILDCETSKNYYITNKSDKRQ